MTRKTERLTEYANRVRLLPEGWRGQLYDLITLTDWLYADGTDHNVYDPDTMKTDGGYVYDPESQVGINRGAWDKLTLTEKRAVAWAALLRTLTDSEDRYQKLYTRNRRALFSDK